MLLRIFAEKPFDHPLFLFFHPPLGFTKQWSPFLKNYSPHANWWTNNILAYFV